MAKDDKKKQEKLQDLLILLTSSFISDKELNKILEDNMRILEDTTAFRVLEARGEARGKAEGKAEGKAGVLAQMREFQERGFSLEEALKFFTSNQEEQPAH